MTVLDTSGVIDFLLGDGVAGEVETLLSREGPAAAPDLLVFEVLAVLRRDVLRGFTSPERAGAAVEDLGDLPVDYFPILPLRHRAWQLRENLPAADALFVALAEQLDEPLATKDTALVTAARTHGRARVIQLARDL